MSSQAGAEVVAINAELFAEIQDTVAEIEQNGQDLELMIETNNQIIQGHAPTLDKINSEIADLSATIEEIASTISNVDAKADAASELAEQRE